MKRILLIVAFLSLGVTFAQNTRVESKVISEFKTAYNASNYEDLYDLYSEEKQKIDSLEKIKIFFERLHKAKGDILSLTLIRKEKAFTVYKAVFTKVEGELVIKLNNKGKADVLITRSTQKVK